MCLSRALEVKQRAKKGECIMRECIQCGNVQLTDSKCFKCGGSLIPALDKAAAEKEYSSMFNVSYDTLVHMLSHGGQA